MYRKFRNVPICKDFPPICPYFLGFRVGKYDSAIFCEMEWDMAFPWHVWFFMKTFSTKISLYVTVIFMETL